MGQTPPKYFMPPSPYGASQGTNVVNPAQSAPTTPQSATLNGGLLPTNFGQSANLNGGPQSPVPQPPQAPQPLQSPMQPNPQSQLMRTRGFFGGLFVLVLLFTPGAFATTSVTGRIQNLGTGNVTSAAFVRFWLRGCAGNQPRVNGTSIIGPTAGGVFFFDISADSSGNISGTLYSTRDSTGLLGGDIECGGSKLGVWYGMQAFVGGKGGPEVAVHAKNGVVLDITSVTPITTNPVNPAPTGDSTYCRLDGGNGPCGTGAPAGIRLTPQSYTGAGVNIPFSRAYRNIAYAGQVQASGGIGPYTFSISSGSLPAGVSLGSCTAVASTCPLTGTPSASSVFGVINSFVMRVVDSVSNVFTMPLTITVYQTNTVVGSPASQSIAPLATLQMAAMANETDGAALPVTTMAAWASTAGATVGASTGLVTAGGGAATPSITAAFDGITSAGVTVTVTGASTTFACSGVVTATLQTALNTAAGLGKTLEITAGSCTTGPLTIPANTSLLIDTGVTISDIAGYGITDNMLEINTGPVTISCTGAASTCVFKMPLSQAQSIVDGSQYRHCLAIGYNAHGAAASNVTISGISCNQSGGDGVLIDSATNVTIQNSLFDSNYRNGGSIVGTVNHINITGNHFTNSNGTLPKSGFDIEPNLATNSIQDVNLTNNFTDTNGGDGLNISLQNLTSASAAVAITVSGHHSDGNGRYGYVAINNDPTNPMGTVLIQNSFSSGDGSFGAIGRFWQDGGEFLHFDKLTVANSHALGPDPAYSSSAAVGAIRGGGVTANMGNISFTGTIITSSNGMMDHYFDFEDYAHIGIAHDTFDLAGTRSGATAAPPNGLLNGVGVSQLP
jgi:hypothetical protein